MTPGSEDLWFLPLGGCGEIGMNMNLYGHDGHWLMVDCGVTFASPEAGGPVVQMADPGFITQRRDQLLGLIVTHAHEDHIGAVAHLWPQLRCPVFVTPFAAAILRRKLVEAGLVDQVPVHVVALDHRHTLGGFDIEWVPLTHSTPESQALVIRTAVGTLFHTGDWKIDDDPVIGSPFHPKMLARLGQQKILAMICDSTNALDSGRSLSEGTLYEGLRQLVADAPGRVVVGCFGSNVARLQTLAKVAADTGRYAALLGRSLNTYYTAAREAGVWDEQYRFIDSSDLGYLPAEEVLVIATGSQGEAGAALGRLASNRHPDLSLSAQDTLLLSSRVIPGNEVAIALVESKLSSLGVRIVRDEELNFPIHASGHPCAEELKDMYRWVQPACAIPVHGEPKHMQAHASLAAEMAVPRQMTGNNGDLFVLKPQLELKLNFAPAGRLGLDQGQLVAI